MMIKGSKHSPAQALSFSTRDLPEKDRLPYWREIFARHVIRLDFEPKSDAPFEAEALLWAAPGLRAHWSTYRDAGHLRRTRELIACTDDNVALIIDCKGGILWSQKGLETQLVPSSAVVVMQSEPAAMTFPFADYMAVIAPMRIIAPLTIGVEDRSRHYIPAATEALSLLSAYLGILKGSHGLSDPQVVDRSVTHIYDLMALAIGATRDAAAVANRRGVRAARLRAVKADIASNLTALDLSVSKVALRQGVTPRYIHMLFDGEGTTFSQYVLAARLAFAYRMLLDPRHAHRPIGSIAYASGFGDLSHFNHAFRRRYDATPSEVRREQNR